MGVTCGIEVEDVADNEGNERFDDDFDSDGSSSLLPLPLMSERKPPVLVDIAAVLARKGGAVALPLFMSNNMRRSPL